ncbi:MAG TPA: hypothetical protein PLY41_03870 [Acetomicrobium sp.]|nr:hypothetical protein [Acetomicrobium sp.]
MAILKLRDTSKSKGIHSVFSGFNQAFREYFNEDPITITQDLASKGKIEVRPVKKGIMIYLPGEAPRSKDEIGKIALAKIFNKPPEYTKGLVDEVISVVAPHGVKAFPEDFIEGYLEGEEMLVIELPGTALELDPNSQTLVVSPKRSFRYEAQNPSQAKYIIYASKIGQTLIKIQRDNRIVFKAVTSYEKYCREIRQQCFNLFLRLTNDEDMASLLTEEAEQKLNLRSKGNQA